MLALQNYTSSDDEDSSDEQSSTSEMPPKRQENIETADVAPYKPPENSEFSVRNQLEVCAAPLVLPTVSVIEFIPNLQT